MKIAIGSDHAAVKLKKRLIAWANEHSIETVAFGAVDETSCDYPDVATQVVEAIRNGQAELGVLCCGTGIGMSIAANRYHGIRAALCCSTQMAELARNHNSANVLCLGARLAGSEDAIEILKRFLETSPSKDPRHVRRVEKLEHNVD